MKTFDRSKYVYSTKVFKALAHPARLFIIEELLNGERCVCELAQMIGVKMPTMSRHLAILKEGGIVEEEKRGVQVFYKIKTPCVLNFFKCVNDVRRKTLRETNMTY